MDRKHLRRRIAAAAVAGALLGGPARADDAPSSLRETGLYVAGSVEQLAPGNRAFAPQYPLWSDGAAKRRWIHLPSGTAIDASGPEWIFPAGTRFWKEFSFAGRRVETRFIERLADGSWRFTSYLWNAAGTDAARVRPAGTPTDVEVIPGVRHQVPAEGDCRSCHEGRPTPVLGFSALQLSPDRDPLAPHAEPAPPGGLDLRPLVAGGLIRGADPRARAPRIAGTPTARAALGYLAANCGGCHNQTGPLAALDLSLDPAAGVAAVLGSTMGRPSRFLPPGAADDALRIAPGQPQLSVLVARMRSRDPLVQMPPLGTRTVDDAGLALVERWIREQTTTKKERTP